MATLNRYRYGNQNNCGCNDRTAPVADRRNNNWFDDDAMVNQDAVQESNTFQGSAESIKIKDSCDVKVHTTDTQVAVSLQVAIQVAIALVINITIADTARAEQVTEELLQRANIGQFNQQSVVIEGSKDIEVTTTDTDVAVSLQVLIQILLALVVTLDIL